MSAPARDLVAGGLAGSVATGLMSAWMLLAERLGLEGEQPSEAVVEAGLDARDRPGRAKTMVLAHLLYGAVVGALTEPDQRS